MNTYTFVHKETGRFAGITIITNSPEVIEHNTPVDHIALKGEYRQHGQRYDHAAGCAVDHIFDPPTPDHVWVPERLRFELRPEIQTARQLRVDSMERIRHLQTEVQPQALRDLAMGREDAKQRLHQIDGEINELRAAIST